jgi:hypothetical protein
MISRVSIWIGAQIYIRFSLRFFFRAINLDALRLADLWPMEPYQVMTHTIKNKSAGQRR